MIPQRESILKIFNSKLNLSESHLTLSFINDVTLLMKPGDPSFLRKAKDDVFFLMFPEKCVRIYSLATK